MAPKIDLEVLAHLEWLGFVQPTGLVVSAPALVRAGAILDRRDAEGQRRLRACVEERTVRAEREPEPVVPDFRLLAERVLDWSFSPKGYAGTEATPIPPELEITLPDYGEALRPDFAVREREPAGERSPWQLLVRELSVGEDLDRVVSAHGGFEASPHGRMERLLRETGVPAGLIFNGRVLRLISAPRGESSGWLDFSVGAMIQTAGRPISTALRLLLREQRLLAMPQKQRFAALLEDSRRFQNEVSERLAQQVLHALYELLRGFQSAHDATGGELLREPLHEHPDQVYRALLTVLLRLVFLLYAEERDMFPEAETFQRFYSLAQLHERLREDAAQHPDTMGQRYGAWAQLLVLFRMVHDGAEAGEVSIPKRHGVLFNPDRFPFLEGRSGATARQVHERIEPPLVPDGTVYRALDKLLVLDGERLSYRALDVEQIGSVYETMMGFRLEVATGRSVAIKAQKRHGAPTTVDLEALLGQQPAERAKWLQDRTEHKLTAKVTAAVKGAAALEDLHAVLTPVTDVAATPDLVPRGAMILQPSEERRGSGSHYTPRALTEPIVRTALEPILDRLREGQHAPRPEQILDLKVCDPAMGSGAFLVEACRQLGDALVEAWAVHSGRPQIPADEDEVVLARRMVAQRCLYGVDRNPVAVDLAKMSLWLVTLARQHPLTFVDHALRHGDSLVGLSRRQIESFHWDPAAPGFEAIRIRDHLSKVAELRAEIREAGDGVSDFALRDLWDEAQAELSKVRLFGDLVVVAFFSGGKAGHREIERVALATAVANGEAERYRWMVEEKKRGERPLVPFHWEVEFPEVFEHERRGFDAIVGNPPFAQKNRVVQSFGHPFLAFNLHRHPRSNGKADLCAFFFRQAFTFLRPGGAFGLVATNTISQGDTREAGLQGICEQGGRIFSAQRRHRWPGSAAVVVSIVHVLKPSGHEHTGVSVLDRRRVRRISAFLFAGDQDASPKPLVDNQPLSFHGIDPSGRGFTFDDASAGAHPLRVMRDILDGAPFYARRIFAYIGGAELNASPTQDPHRYIMSLQGLTLFEAERDYPRLVELVRSTVKPDREARPRNEQANYLARRWWLWHSDRPELQAALRRSGLVLANCQVGPHLAFTFQPSDRQFALTVNIFALDTRSAFGILQSRVHELWARFFGSSMKDDLRYTTSDCFDTFPFPKGWTTAVTLEAPGQTYYDFRAALMVRNEEGLTKTYNRFHDPEEQGPDILRLRSLHAEMDRAVLDAYGWYDIATDCEFILDYEVEDDDSGRRRKPYRYRWPDEVRDEVLARLIELNGERAAAEQHAGAGNGKGPRGPARATAEAPPRREQLA